MNASARIQDYEYLYASNINVSYFVSVKLSGNNYHVWKSQILCLLDSNNMGGIVDDTLVRPRYAGTDTVRKYDILARGWIVGSISEDVLKKALADAHTLRSARSVWDKLKSIYDPPTSLQEGSTSKRPEAEIEKEVDTDANSIEVITETETTNEENRKIQHMNLCEAITKGDMSKIESILKTMTKEEVLKKRDTDGSTALHIAAIVGNKDAADLLVRKNSELLRSINKKNEVPLQKAYENMHLDTIAYLLKASNYDEDTKLLLSTFDSVHQDEKIGVRLIVNAISAKQYCLASEWVRELPNFATETDRVLFALAKNFPIGLSHGEKLIYPSLDSTWNRTKTAASHLIDFLSPIKDYIWNFYSEDDPIAWYIIRTLFKLPLIVALYAGPIVLWTTVFFIYLLIHIVCLSFVFPYYHLWKVADILAVGPARQMNKNKKEFDEAKEVLELVCDIIDELKYSGNHHPHYSRPILEAASNNAYKVVDEILRRSPETILCKDKSTYDDIIQLAIKNRSEKIYNLIYEIGERKNLYRTYNDSSGNNILHMVGKLATSSVLNQKTGAALQLQRELRWREEVKKIVSPTFLTQENIFKETPDMVFTREHENLVKEGEEWMKTTAESCSITAALITTIVFAAAITVPGGSDQKIGTPLFKKETAFIIFAVADAISLFASSTSLLVFLSILTARFAEQDFLVSLPNRLFIGLFSLLLSTTAMMVAFSATLFLVFCDKKPWMLVPICVLALIPIGSFVTLQSPLMVDLFRSTYLRIFGKRSEGILKRFNPDNIRLRFGI